MEFPGVLFFSHEISKGSYKNVWNFQWWNFLLSEICLVKKISKIPGEGVKKQLCPQPSHLVLENWVLSLYLVENQQNTEVKCAILFIVLFLIHSESHSGFLINLALPTLRSSGLKKIVANNQSLVFPVLPSQDKIKTTSGQEYNEEVSAVFIWELIASQLY